MTSIVFLRKRIAEILGSNYEQYVSVMKDWFANKHNRDDWEYDMPFLTGEAMTLHNTLMKSLLNLCMAPDFEERLQKLRQTSEINYFSSGANEFINDAEDSSRGNFITLHSASGQDVVTAPFEMNMEFDGVGVSSADIVDFGESDMEEPIGFETDSITNEPSEFSKSMFRVEVRTFDPGDNTAFYTLQGKGDNRLPTSFVNEIFGMESGNSSTNTNVIPNVTYLGSLEERFQDPELLQYFRPVKEGEHLLTSDATLEGRILLTCWSHGIRTIERNTMKFIMKATRERLLQILRELIKQRKSFHLGPNGRVLFSESHQNPYLISKHHIPGRIDRHPSSVMADANVLPSDSCVIEKADQLAALSASTSISLPSRYKSKIGLTELFELAKQKSSLFGNEAHRYELMEKCLLNAKGYFESLIKEPSDSFESDLFLPSETDSESLVDLEEEEEGELLEICSY